ncbi:MAG: hypothetical protein HYY21_05835, partial [Candidatus Tectomicrobia bacterium]|nr:hypothetical protein [Candidatus Tectomicrobia bacterium]
MAVQSLSDCVYKRAQVKGAVPETFLVYQSYSFGLTALACLGTLSFFYKLAAREGVPASALMFIQFSFFSPLAMAWAALRRRFAWHPASAA